MRLIPWSPVYEPHRPSCMNLIHRMRGLLIYDSYMSLIQNVCGMEQDPTWCFSNIRQKFAVRFVRTVHG